HRESDAALRTNFDRNLVRRTADAARFHFELRLHVVERLAEDLERIFLVTLLDHVEGAVKDPFCDRLLAADHDRVRELADELVLELGVRDDPALRDFSPTGHRTLLSSSGASRRTSSDPACGSPCWCWT